MSELQAYGSDQLNVIHEPMTPRYWRAANSRVLIVRTGVALGERATAHHGWTEIALWCPHPRGRRFCGY